MSGTLLNEGSYPDERDTVTPKACPDGFPNHNACPTCNPVLRLHVDRNPNTGRTVRAANRRR